MPRVHAGDAEPRQHGLEAGDPSEHSPKGNGPKWAPREFLTASLCDGVQQVWSQGWCRFLVGVQTVHLGCFHLAL